ncbi:MAG: hypothetical protein GXP10_07020 [Gammaproteobacteria bacterium]|nr:hypothetical protein [Gammaproteobacteria bacterium]
MNIYDGLLKAIEVAIDRYLDLDPTIKPQLAELAGKIVAVELKGTGITFYLRPTASGIQLLSNYDGAPDATLSGAPFSMLRAWG